MMHRGTRIGRWCITIGLWIPCLFVGCALFPEEEERAAMIKQPVLEQTLAAAADRLPGSERWPAIDWWRLFAAPKLDELIATAVRDNPDLKGVEARLQQSQSLVDVQAAELYPTIHANVSYSAQRYSANSTQAKYAGENFQLLLINPLVLRYHLDLWGRDKAALQAAIGRAMAAETELVAARLLLSAAVAQAYFELASVSEQLLLARKIEDCRERLLHLNQVRLASGLIAPGPVLKAEVEMRDIQQQVAALRANIALQKNRLAALAGKGPDWGRDIAAGSLALPEQLTLPNDLRLHLLAHRPDVWAARQQVEAAAQEIKVAETAFYPDVNLISFAGLHSVTMTDVLLQGSSLAYAVGPSIDFPIFEGGRLRANLAYRRAAYDEAVNQYNSRVLNAVKEVADALAHWQAIDARLAEQRQSLAAVKEKLRLAEVRYRRGLSDRGEWLQAQTVDYQQRLSLAVLQGAHLKAATQVIMALGGGYSENVTGCDETCQN